MKGNAIVGQSGGPTCVINTSLAGVICAVAKQTNIQNIYGMQFGIEGMLQEKIINLSAETPCIIDRLQETPSSILGSCRYKVKESDLEKILTILKKYDIRYFFMIGGNDSMDTISRIDEYCKRARYEINCVGIPKTVDNDLCHTDFSPGYPSAAKYVAISVKQAGRLARDMQRASQFVIHQTVGRDTGWLAAAAALARQKEGDAPHLIYMPERPLSKAQLLSDVKACYKKYGWVSISCGEGIVWENGQPISEPHIADNFSNVEFGAASGCSSAMVLHALISQELGLLGEFQITESLQMAAIDRASKVDLEIAFALGEKAVEIAMYATNEMVAINIISYDPLHYEINTTTLNSVANKTKVMPDAFICSEGNDITAEFLQYLKPIVGEMPEYLELKCIPALAEKENITVPLKLWDIETMTANFYDDTLIAG
ncbi:MAG: diphosphate--fructose-6-phosphate 1-phosphotransferase [Pseudomonadota bacterium]